MYHMGSENDNEPVYRETKSGFMGDTLHTQLCILHTTDP